MTKLNYRFALLASTLPIAFDNTGPHWKMDGDKIAVDGDGNPVFVDANGQERSVKTDTIPALNAENRTLRTAKEAAEAIVAKYKTADGKAIDPETAAKAVKTVADLDAKKLIDAGEVDKVRETMRAEFTGQIDEFKRSNETLKGENNNLKIARVFDSSEFVRDKLAVPRDMFEATFGKQVKISENGDLEFYGRDGNRLMSKKEAGEYAKGDEAFEMMVAQHPQKDAIVRAEQQGGSGNDGGGGHRGNGRVMKRADFEKLDPGSQATTAQAMAKGELSIVD